MLDNRWSKWPKLLNQFWCLHWYFIISRLTCFLTQKSIASLLIPLYSDDPRLHRDKKAESTLCSSGDDVVRIKCCYIIFTNTGMDIRPSKSKMVKITITTAYHNEAVHISCHQQRRTTCIWFTRAVYAGGSYTGLRRRGTPRCGGLYGFVCSLINVISPWPAIKINFAGVGRPFTPGAQPLARQACQSKIYLSPSANLGPISYYRKCLCCLSAHVGQFVL